METLDYLPFEPMPKTKTALMRAMGAHLMSLPFSEHFEDQRLLWAFQYHPWREEKLRGRKLVGFKKRPNFGQYVLMLKRDDGSVTDFSYRKCISNFHNIRTGKPQLSDDYSAKDDLLKAMRFAVKWQIDAWADVHKTEKRAGDVVDHAYPATFSQISDLFLRMVQARREYNDEWSLHLSRVLPCDLDIRDGGPDACFFAVINDADIAEAWENFHAENAVLRWLPAVINSSLNNRRPGIDGLPDGSRLRDVVITDPGWWSVVTPWMLHDRGDRGRLRPAPITYSG